MKRLFSSIILILFLSYPAWTATVRVPEIDVRFELTLKALIARIELNNYYKQTRQYHRLNYVVDMQEEVTDQPFFENVNLVEQKLKDIYDAGNFNVYVIVSIPYAPDVKETEEEIELYKRKFTEALYTKGYVEKIAGKGLIVNIDGTIKQRSEDKKLITAYTAYIGFGSSLSNETIRHGVETLKDFNYFIGRTPSKTQAGIRLVDKVYNTFNGNPNMDFQSSEYTLVYSAESRWRDIYGKNLSDPQPHDAIIMPTPHGTIEDYSGVLYNQLDQDLIKNLSDRIVKSNELLDKPKFQVFITADYHLKNSQSAIQLLYDYQSRIEDNEVVLGFHFRETAGKVEAQCEILIGGNYVYPEQKQKIIETFVLPFLTSNVSFGQILQETLFVSLEYASSMGKLATSFEKSNVPREWWDNDRYFFCLSPETAGVIDGCLEVAGGAIQIGEFGIDMAGTMVDFVSDGKIVRELQDEVGEMLYITLNGIAAYASLTDQEKEELLNEIQGQITQEVSDYFDLLKSGTREGRYESAKLAFNVISTFVGVAELKILFKTGRWPAATAIKIKDLKNAFQGSSRKESIKKLLNFIFKKRLIQGVTKRITSKPSWMPNRVIEGNLYNPKGLIGVYERTLPDGSVVSDTKRMIQELDYPQTFASTFETSSKDGFKILNTNKWYYQDGTQYWDDFNKPWLDELVSKKADVVLLSDKTNDFLKYTWKKNTTSGLPEFDIVPGTTQKIKTGFGKEIEYMENLVQQGIYRWDAMNGIYKYSGN